MRANEYKFNGNPHNIGFKLRSVLLIAIVLTLQSCCMFVSKDKLDFVHENNMVAEKGVYYHDEIKIQGAHIYFLAVKGYEQNPEDIRLVNGLTVRATHPESNYSIEIYGVPDKIGKEDFTIVGGVSGTQCPGYEFEKTFTITTVKSHKNVITTIIIPTKITTTCL